MFRPPLLNMDAVQEKNTFIHVPGTPATSEAFQPLRTTPASFAPPNVLLPQRKRPEPIDPVIEGRPMSMEAQKVNLPTMNSLYAPTAGFFGETPTTTKGLVATSLKLADFVTTPKPTSGVANTGRTSSPRVPSYSNPNSSMSSPQGYHSFANSSNLAQSNSGGGYLPMYNSAIVNSLTPTTHVSVHPVPNITWSQSVEIALAAESAKISAPYTAVGKSLTRTALMA